jgi:hypothetical protein
MPKIRSIYVASEKVWRGWKKAAARDGISVSEMIRQAVERWVADRDKRLQ